MSHNSRLPGLLPPLLLLAALLAAVTLQPAAVLARGLLSSKTLTRGRFSRALRADQFLSPFRTSPTKTQLQGCTYRVNANDTLLTVAGSLDTGMDTLQAMNSAVDLTDPNFFKSNAERTINIPCRGGTFWRFFPVYAAGCFFYYTVNLTEAPTLGKLAANPPPDQLGPFTIMGIWTANFQSRGLDLTKPGSYRDGITIFMPTCGHSGVLPADMLRFPVATGCFFEPDHRDAATNPGSLTVHQLAGLLQSDVATLQSLNPGRNLTADTMVSTSPSSKPASVVVVATGAADTGSSAGAGSRAASSDQSPAVQVKQASSSSSSSSSSSTPNAQGSPAATGATPAPSPTSQSALPQLLTHSLPQALQAQAKVLAIPCPSRM
ncbi:hypothetical protein V8C86DRAFT_2704270, partial [Haematococcus lacustris]